jgi:hypothetical protein
MDYLKEAKSLLEDWDGNTNKVGYSLAALAYAVVAIAERLDYGTRLDEMAEVVTENGVAIIGIERKLGDIEKGLRGVGTSHPDAWAKLIEAKAAIAHAAKARFEAQEYARSLEHKSNKILDIIQSDMSLDKMKKAIEEATY